MNRECSGTLEQEDREGRKDEGGGSPLVLWTLVLWCLGPLAPRSLLGAEAVTDPADGLQVVRHGADLLAQPSHVGVDRAAVDRVLVTPDVLQEAVAGLHPPAAPGQELEQLELGRGELDLAPLHQHRVPGNIDLEVTETQVSHRFLRRLGAGEQLPDAKHELPRAEGLGDVIIRPKFQTEHAVHFRRTRREHDDGNARGDRITPEDLADLEAVDLGQHDIEHDQRRPLVAGGRDRPGAILGQDRGEARLAQTEPEHLEGVGLVVNQQDFRLHDRCAWHRCAGCPSPRKGRPPPRRCWSRGRRCAREPWR